MCLRYSSGVDDLHLAAPERRLEDVRRVDRALGAAGADDGVQLVHKEDHVAGAAHVAQHRFHALLKIAPVLGAGQQRRQIQRHEALVLQLSAVLPAADRQGQALGHRGFAHAGFADEDGVILAAPGEDLHSAPDLAAASDDRVDLHGGRQLRQIAAVLVERAGVGPVQDAARGAGLRALVARRAAAENGHDIGHQQIRLLTERLHRAAAAAVGLPQDAQQQMLGADDALAERLRLAGGTLHGQLRADREPLAGAAGRARAQTAADLSDQRLLEEAAPPQHPAAEAVLLAQDAQQQMLGAHKAVAQVERCLPRLFDGVLAAPGELLVAFH